MKVSEALDSIRKFDMVLPEFQREYVWTLEQAKQLIVSLVRGYPVGGLLLWKTDDPPELKNVQKLVEKIGTVQVLLDGQQRLTTLHMLVEGEIPAYYTQAEIQNDPRDLYYNLETTELQYYQPTKMKEDPAWQRVVDCFQERPDRPQVNIFTIAQRKSLQGQEAFDYAGRLNTNLNKLRSIKDLDLPAQIVPPHASLSEAIDIFDRVNSQGTKLTDAELALTHVTAKWPQARRSMKLKMAEYEAKGFDFGLSFMTRALTTVVAKRALFETIHDRPREQLEAGWKTVTKVLDYLMTFLPQRAFIHSTDDLNTTNALVPLVGHLALNGGKFQDERSLKHAVNWLHNALMWARYTSQTDQRLEADMSLVVKDTLPWEDLRSQIVDQRGRIQVEASDFAGRGAQSPFYRATYILAKAHGAVDWFNGLPLGATHGKSYMVHSHHIFPQGLLYKNGYNQDDYTHRQLVNEIANRAFLTADSNTTLSDTEPAHYLPQVAERYPSALSSQFVPMDPELWKVGRYKDFLEARRQLIALKLNQFLKSLVTEPEPTHKRPIGDLVKLGESFSLEFKSSLQWDVLKGAQNTGLRQEVLRTIAAFLNSQGGTLVIGVEDDGAVYGLDNDLKLMKGSLDKFQQLLVNLVSEHLGSVFGAYYKVRFEPLDGKQVCVVDVDRAPEPVFLKAEKGPAFFVRVGNTTRSLDLEEMHQYVQMNWD
jgi:hypothetical protein